VVGASVTTGPTSPTLSLAKEGSYSQVFERPSPLGEGGESSEPGEGSLPIERRYS